MQLSTFLCSILIHHSLHLVLELYHSLQIAMDNQSFLSKWLLISLATILKAETANEDDPWCANGDRGTQRWLTRNFNDPSTKVQGWCWDCQDTSCQASENDHDDPCHDFLFRCYKTYQSWYPCAGNPGDCCHNVEFTDKRRGKEEQCQALCGRPCIPTKVDFDCGEGQCYGVKYELVAEDVLAVEGNFSFQEIKGQVVKGAHLSKMVVNLWQIAPKDYWHASHFVFPEFSDEPSHSIINLHSAAPDSDIESSLPIRIDAAAYIEFRCDDSATVQPFKYSLNDPVGAYPEGNTPPANFILFDPQTQCNRVARNPTAFPSVSPSLSPSSQPTESPSLSPTATETMVPTKPPTNEAVVTASPSKQVAIITTLSPTKRITAPPSSSQKEIIESELDCSKMPFERMYEAKWTGNQLEELLAALDANSDDRCQFFKGIFLKSVMDARAMETVLPNTCMECSSVRSGSVLMDYKVRSKDLGEMIIFENMVKEKIGLSNRVTVVGQQFDLELMHNTLTGEMDYSKGEHHGSGLGLNVLGWFGCVTCSPSLRYVADVIFIFLLLIVVMAVVGGAVWMKKKQSGLRQVHQSPDNESDCENQLEMQEVKMASRTGIR